MDLAPRKPRLVLFGAGPIGRAFAAQFALLPFQVEAYDARPELSDHAVILSDAEMVEAAACLEDGDYALVATHSHDLDYGVAAAILKAGRAKFLGMVGSRGKRDGMIARLQAEGFSEEVIARLNCPVGMPGLKGKAPEMIAVSAAAQILGVLNQDD
jgi:xanthine dehydrogenase accessory factor